MPVPFVVVGAAGIEKVPAGRVLDGDFDRVPNVGVRAASLAVESRKRLSPRILIAEVRIRRKAITAYGHDTRNDGRCGPDAAIRRRHGQHDRELIRVMAESLVNEIVGA